MLTWIYPFDRGVWGISRHVGAWVDGEALITTKRGTKLLLRLENYIDRIIYLFGKYEEPLISRLEQEIKSRKCEILVDVGANLGYYSLSIDKLRIVGEIYCFEPDPVNLVMLRANILLNNADGRIKVHAVAATSHRCELPFELQRSEGHLNTGLSRILHEGENSEGEVILVPGMPVDELLNWRGRRLAIKIDVEGAEEDSLKGMKNLLIENQCVLQIEVWPKNTGTISKYLTELGYNEIEKIGEQDIFWTNMGD